MLNKEKKNRMQRSINLWIHCSFFLFLIPFCPVLHFKVQELRSCSTFRFRWEIYPSSDRANTGLMHSSLAYLSKYSLLYGSMTICPCHQINKYKSIFILRLIFPVLCLFFLVSSFLISGCLTFSLALVRVQLVTLKAWFILFVAAMA